MGRLFQARALKDINSKIKKGFMITGETAHSKPTGSEIKEAVEKQYGKDAAAHTTATGAWEILS